MKVKEQYMVVVKGSFQLLAITENGKYYITSNGGFGQRDLYFEALGKEEAEKYIKQAQENYG